MADQPEKEIKPAAITYADVAKSFGDDTGGAAEAWKRIGEITGAGHVPASDTASIDITGLADGKLKAVEAAAKPKKEGK